MYSTHLGFDSDLSDICDSVVNENDTFPPSPDRSLPSSPQTPDFEPCNTLFTAPVYTGLSAVHARNSSTAVVCGCKGHFFWEILSVHEIDYYRGTAPDCVDRCISSLNMYRTFNEAFWDAYNHCIDSQNTVVQHAALPEDFVIAVYQQHTRLSCGKHYTRYTLGSYKQFMLFNQKLRETPVVGTLCRCDVPKTSPADIAYTVCFTCLQTTLELKAQFLPGVLQNFSYEVSYKQGFLGALQKGIRNTTKYFTAQSLFEPSISTVSKLRLSSSYLNQWRHGRCGDAVSWRTLQRKTSNQSYCILCNRPGNGYDCFSCKSCMRVTPVYM